MSEPVRVFVSHHQLLGALLVALIVGSVGSGIGILIARLGGPKPQAAVTPAE
jgi:hypothetical protein